MTWKILVPLDGSQASNRALPWANELARGLEAAVTITHVQPAVTSRQASTPLSGHVSQADSGGLGPSLEAARAAIHTTAGANIEILQGNAASVLAEQARESYDLVVMASELRDGLGRIGHPSVAWSVIRDSGTPVLVVPPNVRAETAHSPRRVVVPLDGSETSVMILSHLAPLARALHWMVILLGVVPKGAGTNQEALATQAYLSHLATDLHRQLVATRSITRVGEPGPAILELTRAASADMIAMSTHSQRGMNPLRVGSVTEYVLARATTPVLTFHPSAIELFESPVDVSPSKKVSERLLAKISAREAATK